MAEEHPHSLFFSAMKIHLRGILRETVQKSDTVLSEAKFTLNKRCNLSSIANMFQARPIKNTDPLFYSLHFSSTKHASYKQSITYDIINLIPQYKLKGKLEEFLPDLH